MYRVTVQAGEQVRTLHNNTSPDLVLGSVELSRELNYCGSLSFEINIKHPYYELIGAGTILRAYIRDVCVFVGEIERDSEEIFGTKSVQCLGVMYKTSETIQPYVSNINLDVREYMEFIIDNHNAMIENPLLKLQVGNVTVVDSNNNLYRQSHYDYTNEALSQKLVQSIGGYMNTRHVGDVNYIDYVSDFTEYNAQRIKFGENIIGIAIEKNHSEVYSAIYPLGAKINETEQRYTISEINDGKPYIVDADAEAVYGRKYKKVTYDDVTDANILFSKAEEELSEISKLYSYIEVNAIDLNNTSVKYERLTVGQYVEVINPINNLNEIMLIAKIDDDFNNPANSKIYLNATIETLVEKIIISDNEIETIKADYVLNEKLTAVDERLSSEITQNAEEITLKVTKGNISSEISTEAGLITISSDRFVLDSTNLKIEKDGTIRAYKGVFSGDISTEKSIYIGNNLYLLNNSPDENKLIHFNDFNFIESALGYGMRIHAKQILELGIPYTDDTGGYKSSIELGETIASVSASGTIDLNAPNGIFANGQRIGG